jgi:hypothetical protein
MINNKRIVLFIFFLMFLVNACSQDNNQKSNDSADHPFRVEGELPTSPVVQGWITEAVNDLAQKLDVDVADVTYIAFEVPVWPDASYGCPQAGQEYGPGSKEGYQIQLQVNGRYYFIHGGEDIEQFLCESK